MSGAHQNCAHKALDHIALAADILTYAVAVLLTGDHTAMCTSLRLTVSLPRVIIARHLHSMGPHALAGTHALNGTTYALTGPPAAVKNL